MFSVSLTTELAKENARALVSISFREVTLPPFPSKIKKLVFLRCSYQRITHAFRRVFYFDTFINIDFFFHVLELLLRFNYFFNCRSLIFFFSIFICFVYFWAISLFAKMFDWINVPCYSFVYIFIVRGVIAHASLYCFKDDIVIHVVLCMGCGHVSSKPFNVIGEL